MPERPDQLCAGSVSGPMVKSGTDLAEVTTQRVLPGWDSLGRYVMVKGRVRRGRRVAAVRGGSDKAFYLLACVSAAAKAWKPLVLNGTVEQDHTSKEWVWRWAALHPITDRWGVAPELIAEVDKHHPEGQWRYGTYPGLPDPFELLVVKVNDNGEVVGVVAPCRRVEERS